MQMFSDEGPITTVPRLLAPHDAEFIKAAYEAVLGRAPDQEGFTLYLSLLRTGAHKLEILKRLRRSVEGRQFIPGVAGLDRAIKRYRLVQWPIVGSVLAKIWALQEQHPSGRQLRAIANEFARVKEENSDALRSLQSNWRNSNNEVPLKADDDVRRIALGMREILYQIKNDKGSKNKGAIGVGDRRFLMNITTSNLWRSHPVGIVRVEREIARYMSEHVNVDFVVWDRESLTLRKITDFKVAEILSDAWCEPSSNLSAFRPGECPEIQLSDADTYISVGLDWDNAPTPQVLPYLKAHGAKAALFCHDLVPVSFPEFLVRPELGQEFKHHLLEMAHGADKVFVVSESSKRDLLKFWQEAEILADLPEVVVTPLASFTSSSSLPRLSADEESVMRSVFRKGEYVLYVSSFEPRKNYKLALDVWRELWRERGQDCPQFVHVGAAGWGTDDLRNRIPRMPAYVGGKINGLTGVSDNLLAHLYANCSFTIFPSLYEGWGLAATESLSFGKICVVANNSSLLEAVQNLMPAFHPLDFLGWKNEIDRLLDDQEYKKALENRITESFVSNKWDHFGKSFCEHLVKGKLS